LRLPKAGGWVQQQPSPHPRTHTSLGGPIEWYTCIVLPPSAQQLKHVLTCVRACMRACMHRLGPGRIHHCMRTIGVATRAYELMCQRAVDRVAFGQRLARHGMVQQQIAESKMEIDQARLLVLHAARLVDAVGGKKARSAVAAAKVAAPRMALRVLDRAIQVHGGAGVCQDFPLAYMWAMVRTLRIADGPDEVHMMSIARDELARLAREGVIQVRARL